MGKREYEMNEHSRMNRKSRRIDIGRDGLKWIVHDDQPRSVSTGFDLFPSILSFGFRHSRLIEMDGDVLRRIIHDDQSLSVSISLNKYQILFNG